MLRVFVCAILLVALVQADYIFVNPSTHMFEDAEGRERYFRGVNVVYKAFPYLPPTGEFDPKYSFGEKDWQILQDLGLNLVRLGVMWPGVEPTRNSYNQTYMTLVRDLALNLHKHGIYVLADFHQDLLSEKFCGEGVPPFAAQPKQDARHRGFPFPLSDPFPLNNETGFPFDKDCAKHDWPLYYLTEASSSAFQNLYDNYDGLADSFANYWKQVAQTLSDTPNLLGYDLFNEPFAGDIFMRPELLLPGVADKKNLQQFYDRVAKEIRKVDDSHIVFIESITWDAISVGFEYAPGGPEYHNRSGLSYHHYKPPMITPELTFRVRWADMERLNIGGLLSEFDISSVSTNIPNLISTLDAAERHRQSWIGWEYKPMVEKTGWGWCIINPDGTVNMEVAKVLSRTYARAVAGQVRVMQFNITNGDFLLRFEANTKCKGNTEIFVPQELHYPKGFAVSVSPTDAGEWTVVDKQTIVFVLNSSLQMDQLVTIQISAQK